MARNITHPRAVVQMLITDIGVGAGDLFGSDSEGLVRSAGVRRDVLKASVFHSGCPARKSAVIGSLPSVVSSVV